MVQGISPVILSREVHKAPIMNIDKSADIINFIEALKRRIITKIETYIQGLEYNMDNDIYIYADGYQS